MSKSWRALAFVFLNQQTALYNVAQQSPGSGGWPSSPSCHGQSQWPGQWVCPRQWLSLLVICHPGRSAQPNMVSFSHPRGQLLRHSLNRQLASFTIKPMMGRLKDVCLRWIEQRTQLPRRTISSRMYILRFILLAHYVLFKVHRMQRNAWETTARKVPRYCTVPSTPDGQQPVPSGRRWEAAEDCEISEGSPAPWSPAVGLRAAIYSSCDYFSSPKYQVLT